MAFRFQHHARRRAQAAAVLGVVLVVLLGPLVAVPALALVALVYYAHQLAAALLGDDGVAYPSLAFVIVVNSLVVLVVELVVFVNGFGVRA